MSDMKLYSGKYSYTGKYKQQDDGSSILEVTDFEYDGKYFQPSEHLKLKITQRDEGDGWISITDESIGVNEGGKDLEEALGNAFMDAALQYEELVNDEEPMTEKLKTIKDKVSTWLAFYTFYFTPPYHL